MTSASWRFKTGAIGTLTHSSLQHEQNFFTTFEILADGLHIIIGTLSHLQMLSGVLSIFESVADPELSSISFCLITA